MGRSRVRLGFGCSVQRSPCPCFGRSFVVISRASCRSVAYASTTCRSAVDLLRQTSARLPHRSRAQLGVLLLTCTVSTVRICLVSRAYARLSLVVPYRIAHDIASLVCRSQACPVRERSPGERRTSSKGTAGCTVRCSLDCRVKVGRESRV